MSEIGFGIVGCNLIAPWHAGGVRETEGAVLAAACDRVLERAENLCREFGGRKAYNDYGEMLADPAVNVVCICTPSGTHTDLGIQAVQAGKHVLIEKPLGIELGSIDRLIAAAREGGVKLGVIFQIRACPVWPRIREAVQSGRLGRMVLGDTYVKYYRTPEYYRSSGWRGTWGMDGGGALMNQAIHNVDLLQWIMGPVESVFAYADHLTHRIETEDTAAAAVRFASGALGIIEAATSAVPGFERRMEFHGERGTIRMEGDRIVAWDVPGDEADYPAGQGGLQVGSASSDPRAISGAGHLAQIRDFVEAIREDREPMVSGEEGRKAVEIILAIYESVRQGREVRLPL